LVAIDKGTKFLIFQPSSWGKSEGKGEMLDLDMDEAVHLKHREIRRIDKPVKDWSNEPNKG